MGKKISSSVRRRLEEWIISCQFYILGRRMVVQRSNCMSRERESSRTCNRHTDSICPRAALSAACALSPSSHVSSGEAADAPRGAHTPCSRAPVINLLVAICSQRRRRKATAATAAAAAVAVTQQTKFSSAAGLRSAVAKQSHCSRS